jgi:hypothetical protein
MNSVLAAFLVGGSLAASAATAGPLETPRLLEDFELDGVTAGETSARATTGSDAQGNITATDGKTGAIAAIQEGSKDGLYSSASGAVGTSVALAAGGNSSKATTASADSTADGTWSRTHDTTWTAS